jgi:hypothetical protein
MWHTVLISLHAISGTVALLAGCLAHRGRALFETYLWSLVATIAFLGAAVAEEWTRLDALSRTLFGAFAVLGLLMLWLAFGARRLPAPSPRYVDRVGFTVVALFDAFAVIAVLNAGAPVALVVAAGLVVAIAGHFVLRVVKAAVVDTSGERTLVQE